MNSTELTKEMTAGKEKDHLVETADEPGRGKLGWDLICQRVKSHKKPGSFYSVVGPCQLIQGLTGAIGDTENVLHCIAIKSAFDCFKNAC